MTCSRARAACLVLALPVLLLGGAWASSSAAQAEEPAVVDVPDVRQQRVPVAQLRLEEAGLAVGRLWRMSVERLAKDYGIETTAGAVAFQRPKGGVRRPRGHAVDLIVAAAVDGPLPERLPPPTVPRDPTPTPDTPSPGVTEPEPGSPHRPEVAPGTTQAPTPPVSPPSNPDDIGSPEAPAPAPPADRQVVPPLLGLHLPVAEQLARDAEMTLYVDRVPGHPVGRVLRQSPEPYSARPRGGVVKVVVTAGGDFEGETAPPPAVHVDEVDVPSLLDRTGPQALRILRDLRLVGNVLEAERGPAGRIVDQKPRPRERVPVGTLVQVWVAPGDPGKPAPPPTVEVPSAPEVPARPEPGPAALAGAPKPLAPAAGTALPRQASIDIGFTWSAIDGADGYLLEVDEQTADGAWLGVSRVRAKRTAEIVTVERLDPRAPRALRWRVAALVAGRPGPFCAWTTLP
ncbi:MAG: hypothetical protein R3F05_13575 [Planctomycetota bacterium]